MAKGGKGGNALVEGDDSTAEGGRGGEAVRGDGGPGGNATVRGNRSAGKGGKGGRGGVGPGGPGGHVDVHTDDTCMEGGNGGEASQHDGRGGRGGSAPRAEHFAELLGRKARPHLRWPYGEPVDEPGRGGDAPDTPQYKARRVIIEHLKVMFFVEQSLPLVEVWWDREIVSLDWLNSQLAEEGHRWRVTIVDEEYEFQDVRA